MWWFVSNASKLFALEELVNSYYIICSLILLFILQKQRYSAETNVVWSGGPLTVMKKSQHVLMGTAISDLSCGKMDNFAVFSMISRSTDLIMKNMKNPKFCPSGPNAKE